MEGAVNFFVHEIKVTNVRLYLYFLSFLHREDNVKFFSYL